MTDVATTITAITSTIGSGATVLTHSRRVTTPWRSVVKMTRRTVRGHVRLEEIFNNNKNGGLKRTCLVIRRKSKTGGTKHTCPVVKLESGSGVSKGPHLLFRRKPQSDLFNFSSGADAAHECSLSLWLQVQPWNNADPWNQYGTVGINRIIGLHVAMMMSGRRGHSGTVNRRSTSTRARLQIGTGIILRKPGVA